MTNTQKYTSLEEATGKLDYLLTNDCMFHVVFQKNPKALLGLCASLLHMHPEEIRSVEVLNPFEFKTMPTDKTFVLDLKVLLNDDRILNFEVQVVDEKDWPERSLSYSCRTFDQLQKGETYLDVKPVRHIGFLDYDLEDFSPEFYATYMLLNIKNHEIYSDKLAISVVNLNQIDKATEEDHKYGIDHWAHLFKATTWEAIKKMAQENEYISSAAETMLESSQDSSMRIFMEGVEEANRIRRGQEIRLERAETALQEAKEELQAKDDELQENAKELKSLTEKLGHLKALLAEKITPEEYTSIMQELGLFQELDKGLDDMEAGRELPLEEAFKKVTELREQHRK